MYRLTTVTGRVYEIDTESHFWRRLPKSAESATWWGNTWERTYSMKAASLVEVGEKQELVWEERMPAVGELLFISSRDIWFRSTKIASVEEVPGGFRTKK